MGLIQSIGRALGVIRSNQFSSLNITSVGVKEVYVSIDTEKAISEGYNGNTAVFSIVSRDAKKFASIPVEVYKVGSEEEEKLDNDLSRLLKRPNPDEAESFFREKLRTYYKVCGEAFIWLNRGALADTYIDDAGNEIIRSPEERMKMPVLEMYVLPTDYVEVLRDTSNVFGITGYNLLISGQKKFIPKEDIIHWKTVNLDYQDSSGSHLRGRSPLSSGYKTLQQNNSATDSAVRMYQNDGAKGAMFNETMDQLDPSQKEAAKGMVNRRINSNDVKSAVAVLPGKWGYIDLGKTNTDLALIEGKDASMKELCFLLDVPFTLFDPETAFANSEWQQKNWINNSIIPACRQFDGELNRVLLKAFGLEGKAVIESDYDGLPELQEDLKAKISALMSAWPITPDEVRQAINFEPLGGRFAEPWVPNTHTPLSESGLNLDQMAADLAAQGLNE